MPCSLINECPKEHQNQKSEVYKDTVFICPITGKQICLWCCLHIAGLADPKTRMWSEDKHPEYTDVVNKMGKDWNQTWQICSRCRNH
jgi:hypothetical protein